MSEHELQDVLRKLKSAHSFADSAPLLSKAKIILLKLHALTPRPTTPPSVLNAAREVFEAGALLSIRAKDPAAFTRYVHQLTPFYEQASPASGSSEKSKITGLYLLLLLTQGDYAGFHTELEGLERRLPSGRVEDDRFLGYPIKLERWLMEGSYDLVWKAMASREVPSEEYGIFSEVCVVFLLLWRALTGWIDFDVPDPQRDRLVQRDGVSVPAHLVDQGSAFPGQRGRRYLVCAEQRMGY